MLVNFKVCDDLDACLEQLNFNPKLAVAVSSEYIRSNRRFPTSNFYCFEKDEIIYSYSLKFLVRKDFSHLHKFEQFVKMVSNGLVKKWNSDARTHPNYREHDEKYNGISLAHFYGVFVISLVLILAAFVVLFLEKYVYKKARELGWFWKFTEMIIDPDRHFMLEGKMC